MKKAIMAALAMVLLGCSCSSQEAKVIRDNQTATFQPAPLDDEWSRWLVGQWEGSAESDAGTARLQANIDFGLNGQFLIIESQSQLVELSDGQTQYLKGTLNASEEDIEAYRNATFRELQTNTIDPKTGQIIGYLFDSMRCTAEGRGRREGNREIIEWKWSGNAQGATSVRVIERVDDNTQIVSHTYILPNGKKMEDSVQMTRVRVAEK